MHKKYGNVYNAECPVCNEGKSAGRSRRLFYFPSKGYLYCHNCCRSWKPYEWVKEVSGLTFPEIMKRNDEKAGVVLTPQLARRTLEEEPAPEPLPDLPVNSIDLSDTQQVEYYKDEKFVQAALECCVDRRLFSAVNSCKKFYVSLEDQVHKNRLVLPFYDLDGKTVCYQTRALTNNQFPRYLTKFGEKHLFGLNNITEEIPYVFVFEGPIDSMFIRNGVAIASINPTEKQESYLKTLLGYEMIYVFDNDKGNKETAKRIKKHVSEGKRIFIWPQEFKKFKDFNEVCCQLKMDEIPWQFVVKNSASGPEAQIKLRMLNK